MLDENPEGAPLVPAYDELIAALAAGQLRRARRLLEEFVEATEVDHDLVTHGNLFIEHGLSHLAQLARRCRNAIGKPVNRCGVAPRLHLGAPVAGGGR
jgi:hypothetical protein